MAKIRVENTEIAILTVNDRDYISLTDMANAKGGESRAADIIKNWLRTRYTLEFLGTWEQIHNPTFKVVEFDHFKMQAGLPSFVVSVSEWVEKTNAIGIIVKKGK
ncbi:MAG: DNA-binding protein [Bacteroidetes bacterium OLB12]|nr:MAG: DNA-binding protein [Bacteroidetes bacterium OLB12]